MAAPRMPRAIKGRLGKGAAGAAALAIAIGLVGPWEGKELKAYRDIVGVWTVCYGETRGVRPGDRYTDAECEGMLAAGLGDFSEGIDKCIVEDRLPNKSYVAHLSLSYNIGLGAYCKSTAARRVNENRLPESCDALIRFNRAGGKVVRGLVRRRAAEQKLCHEGLAEMSRPLALAPIVAVPSEAPQPHVEIVVVPVTPPAPPVPVVKAPAPAVPKPMETSCSFSLFGYCLRSN